MNPQQREQFIDNLFRIYDGSGELIMGQVLSVLREGDQAKAWKLAADYYAGPLPLGPIRATYSTVNIYRGHLRALCKVLNTNECRQAAQRFKEMHADRPMMGGAESWGYQITMTAAGSAK